MPYNHYQALTDATTFDQENAADLGERCFGRDNYVDMELYQAVSLISESQKSILNDLVAKGGKLSMVRVALGQGRHKQGTIGLCVQRDIGYDTAHIDITPRGGLTGMVFDHPWREREEGEPTRHEVKSFAGLVLKYKDMGLY